jgi:hypothetical protein
MHQASILVDVDAADGLLQQTTDRPCSSHPLQKMMIRQPGRHSHQVSGLALAVQLESSPVNLLVGRDIEHLWTQKLRDPHQRIRIEENAPQDFLLGFNVLRRKPIPTR